jgi:secondary thiamine-phosphate synthase enzyme
MTFTKEIELQEFSRGYHIITNIIAQSLESCPIQDGLVNAFIKHTSASLSINENADPTVRSDLEKHLNRIIPDQPGLYDHDYEGLDDMPAHIKAALLGHSVQIPLRKGKLVLGTWQGIYLGEHRRHGGHRKIVITVVGE